MTLKKSSDASTQLVGLENEHELVAKLLNLTPDGIQGRVAIHHITSLPS